MVILHFSLLKMLVKILLIHLVLASVSFLVLAEDELKIDVVTKPDSCDRKTKRGDMLKMHYKGTLMDGTVFDSRWVDS